jgi:hypothetical protein
MPPMGCLRRHPAELFMRNYLIEFLKMLEVAIPPPENCHHAITYARYGSDADGWQDKLALQINLLGEFHCIFLEEDDLSLNAEKTVKEIERILFTPMSAEQLGVALGQYLPGSEVKRPPKAPAPMPLEEAWAEQERLQGFTARRWDNIFQSAKLPA